MHIPQTCLRLNQAYASDVPHLTLWVGSTPSHISAHPPHPSDFFFHKQTSGFFQDNCHICYSVDVFNDYVKALLSTFLFFF